MTQEEQADNLSSKLLLIKALSLSLINHSLYNSALNPPKGTVFYGDIKYVRSMNVCREGTISGKGGRSFQC